MGMGMGMGMGGTGTSSTSTPHRPFLLHQTLSSISSHPLFLTFFTFYSLIFLYIPSLFPRILFSPVLLSTGLLLLSLLRLGASARHAAGTPDKLDYREFSSIEGESLKQGDHEFCSGGRTLISDAKHFSNFEPSSIKFCADSFVEWDVGAPLEVIYEEYEGEGADEYDGGSGGGNSAIIQNYATLGLFYPESDTDNSSNEDSTAIADWNSPSNLCFHWEEEEEEDRDGLIEISIEEKRIYEVDEDNLIEIDLSPARLRGFVGEVMGSSEINSN